MSTARKTLTIAALVLMGTGLLTLLARIAPVAAMDDPSVRPGSAPWPEVRAPDGPAEAGAEGVEHPDPASVPAPIAAEVEGGSVLLLPPGSAPVDLALLAEGGWTRPSGATRPAESRPAESRPGVVLALPGSLGSLGPRARASLAQFLESRHPRAAVSLPPDASDTERAELRKLLGWLR